MFLDVPSLGKNRVRGVFPVFIPSVEDTMGKFKYNQEALKNLTLMYGNVNTHMIGADFNNPDIRLTGSGAITISRRSAAP